MSNGALTGVIKHDKSSKDNYKNKLLTKHKYFDLFFQRNG